METSHIKLAGIQSDLGILIGNPNAPVTLVEYINVRCPFCKQWFFDSKDLLANYRNTGKIKQLIKLYDKESPGLQMGNVMHRFIPTINSEDTLKVMELIYQTQDEWGNLAQVEQLEKIAAFAENTLQLTPQDVEEQQIAIIREAEKAGIQFVPTMIVNSHIFDQKIESDKLQHWLDEAYHQALSSR
ncbi:DsbA family protein [Vagococcus humatus]|uniref:Thioredoxin n=1 Tax=Vagococcus humatus TaxID=1889241 RepID=A0A429Z912_9ENTE|nr:DsbA family protein [Vagococcus humatus]RST90197.1 thioredoxin [Vagococcus humatus]